MRIFQPMQASPKGDDADDIGIRLNGLIRGQAKTLVRELQVLKLASRLDVGKLRY